MEIGQKVQIFGQKFALPKLKAFPFNYYSHGMLPAQVKDFCLMTLTQNQTKRTSMTSISKKVLKHTPGLMSLILASSALGAGFEPVMSHVVDNSSQYGDDKDRDHSGNITACTESDDFEPTGIEPSEDGFGAAMRDFGGYLQQERRHGRLNESSASFTGAKPTKTASSRRTRK